jgi:hypothetical protein
MGAPDTLVPRFIFTGIKISVPVCFERYMVMSIQVILHAWHLIGGG